MHNQNEAQQLHSPADSFRALLVFSVVPLLLFAAFFVLTLFVLKPDPAAALGKNPLAAIAGLFACGVCLWLSSLLALQLAWLYQRHQPSDPPLEFGYKQQVYGLSGERKTFVTKPVALAGSSLSFAALGILILRIAIVTDVPTEKEKAQDPSKAQTSATAITIENSSGSSMASPNPGINDAQQKPKPSVPVKPKINCTPCPSVQTP